MVMVSLITYKSLYIENSRDHHSHTVLTHGNETLSHSKHYYFQIRYKYFGDSLKLKVSLYLLNRLL